MPRRVPRRAKSIYRISYPAQPQVSTLLDMYIVLYKGRDRFRVVQIIRLDARYQLSCAASSIAQSCPLQRTYLQCSFFGGNVRAMFAF